MRRKKKNTKLIIILSVVLIIGLVMLFIISKSNNKTENNAENLKGYTVGQQIEDEEAYIIETKYCDLYFPQKWESSVRSEIIEERTYKVMFYGSVNEKKEQKIFEICFGEADGLLLGNLNIEGEEVAVYLVIDEFEFSNEWSEEEKNTICSMQEDMNYLIGILKNEKCFESIE